MIIIDTRSDKAFENLSKREAARILGVNPSTIFRWAKKGSKQVYNSFEVYFNVERRKQKKGKPQIPPHEKKKQMTRRW